MFILTKSKNSKPYQTGQDNVSFVKQWNGKEI